MKLLSQSILMPMLLLSALSFATCKVTERHPVTPPPGFDWQGHRGCRGLLPENSIPAFLHALSFSDVTTLELDLAVSKDHQLIVSHEPWFNPAICTLPDSANAELRYRIYEKTVEEISTIDCGSKGNPRFPEQTKQRTGKPTLDEVVEAVQQAFPNREIRWNIEIKSDKNWDGQLTPPIAEYTRLVLEAVRRLKISSRCTVQSFDVRPLQILHQEAPDLLLTLLVENTAGLEANIRKLGFTPYAYSPYYLMVNKKLVRHCHQKGMKLIPWTVNDVPAMRRLIRLGVDGIITDYPNRIKTATTK